MDEIAIEKTPKGIRICVPLKSKGKFRCKNRSDFSEYGQGFAPAQEVFSEESYVEWQIGYDATEENLRDGKKTTSLKNESLMFTGANGKKKYLYELSEIVWRLCEADLITKTQIARLLSEIESYAVFLQENFQIQMKSAGTETINGIATARHEILLPTFTFDAETPCEIFTEISIQKQQYATGVQPMLYVIVPVTAFDNAAAVIGNTSRTAPLGFYTIETKKKAEYFLKIFSYFGLCSENHRHDVLEILKIVRDRAF